MSQESSSQERDANNPSSHGALWGTLLFIIFWVSFLGVLVWLGWIGYRMWHQKQEEVSLPSIAALPTKPVTEEQTPTPESPAVTPAPEAPKQSETNWGRDIKVLNGGAAKGSANTVADILKKAGYTKVAAGNSAGNYTGTVVYFATGLENEAAAVQKVLLKSYPKTETKAALKGNSDTAAAVITVILGK